MGKDTTAFRERFNAYKNGKSVSEIYDAGLPRYRDGKRYLYDEQEKSYNRITDDEYARAFADLTVTPSGNKMDIRTNPVYHDPRLKAAGYVTNEMLEDQQNAIKQHETSVYAPGLEQVSPEFDLLFMGAGSRINPLTQKIHKTRTLAKQMNKVFDDGLIGATKDMPVVRLEDVYNPQHFVSTVKYNPKQIETVVNQPKVEPAKVASKPGEYTASKEITIPEELYGGPIPKTSISREDLYKYKDQILKGEPIQKDPISLPENKMSEYVDSEGNVNMRNVVTAVRDFYKNHPEARNYKDVYNSSGNLYQHISAVVKSAQEAPVPEGYTRQQLVQSALFHDIGKVLDPDRTHDKMSVKIMDELGIETTPEVRTAVGRHMSSHLGNKDALSKALHFVDVTRGQDIERMKESISYLGYPGIRNNKINPQYSKDTRWQLANIINPILDKYGYTFSTKEYSKYGIKYVEGDPIIPLDVDDATARQMVLDKIKQHRTFVRSLYESNGHDWENLRKQTAEQLGKNKEDVTNEEMFQNAAQYIKKKDTNSGVMGLPEYLRRYELNDKDFQALYASNRDHTAAGYTTGSNSNNGASYYLSMNINDNPDWSLAELWANNEFPVIYSSGNVRGGTDWRNFELPFRLNTGLDLNKELESVNHEARIFNERERNRIEEDAFNSTQQYFKEHPEQLKDVVSYYGDTYPTKYRQGSYALTGKGDIETWGSDNLYDDSNVQQIKFNGTYAKMPSFTKNELVYGMPTTGGIPGIGNFSPEKLNKFNQELRTYGIKEMLPSMSSTIKDKILHINYPQQFVNLMDQVTSPYSPVGDFKRFISSTDSDIYHYYKDYIFTRFAPPTETTVVGQYDNGDPIFGEDVAKSYITKLTVDFAKDVADRLHNWHLISDKQYYAIIKNKDFDSKPRDVLNKYVNIKALYRSAINNYFKEVKIANKKDAFIRRSSVKDVNDKRKKTRIENKLQEFRDQAEKASLKKEYSKEELMKAYNVDPDFSYMSPDGYRVFSTERLSEPDPDDLSGNHYVIVGPRGSKQLNIIKNYNPTINTTSHNHRGSRIKGTSRNLGSVLYPVTIAGGTATLINNKNKKK